MDPITAGLGAVQAVAGGIQAIVGGARAKRAQRAYEKLATPTTTSSATISDYYNRASANPYDTAFYKGAQQNIARGTAQGLGALQTRGGGLSGVAALIRQQNDAYLRAAGQAEGMQRSMLGQAVGMKARDDERVFQINKMMPYEKMAQLYAAKAAGGNQIMNAGLQNVFGGIGTAAMGLTAPGGGGLGSLFGRGGGGAAAAPGMGLGSSGLGSIPYGGTPGDRRAFEN